MFGIFPNTHRSMALDDCVLLGKRFLMNVIDTLDIRFIDLTIFDVSMFFIHFRYYEDMDGRDSQTRIWLICLCEKFSLGDSPIVDTNICLGQMDTFNCTIYKSYPKRIILEHGLYVEVKLKGLKVFHV
jgi:hypothetical protein